MTPPSVTPPSVSTDISLVRHERDRCTSPSQKASALLAKVAVLPCVPGGTSPMPTGSGMSSLGLSSSSNSSPASSPPGEGEQFSFGNFPKHLPPSPNGELPLVHPSARSQTDFMLGGYISFPDFDQFAGYNSEDEDTPSHKR